MQPLKSLEEAAALLGISKWTVRSYIKTRRLRPVRLGRRVLLPEEELERLVAEGQHAKVGNAMEVPTPENEEAKSTKIEKGGQ